jgi:DNA-binding NarL/FixJ family response regulator
MAKVQVLLALSHFKRILDLKTLLMLEPDTEIVGEAHDTIDILLEVGSTHADVVIIDLPPTGEDSGLCSHLLAEYPQVKIIAISEIGDKVVTYEIGVVRRYVPGSSLENLVDVVRASMN